MLRLALYRLRFKDGHCSSSEFSQVGIDVKVPLLKVPLPNTTGHKTSISQNYWLENKLVLVITCSGRQFVINCPNAFLKILKLPE